MTLKQRLGRSLIPRLPISRRSFNLLRFEFGILARRCWNQLNPFYHCRIAALRKMSHISLNLGSGGRGSAEWINVDARRHADTWVVLDIRRRLPFVSGSVRRILAEHVVEHLDFRSDVPLLFSEMHRVLEKGGVVRIVVPDAERYLEAYVSKDSARWKELGWDLSKMPEDILTPMHAINHVFRQEDEHQFAYDYKTLELVLKQAGFQKIVQQEYQKSLDEHLKMDQPNHAPYSLYVEAIK